MSSFVAIDSLGFAQKSFVADSLEAAQAISGMRCVASLAVPIGWKRDEDTGQFRPLSPFESWAWDAETNAWIAPEPRPETGEYYWDEELLSWIALEPVEDTPAEGETNAIDA